MNIFFIIIISFYYFYYYFNQQSKSSCFKCNVINLQYNDFPAFVYLSNGNIHYVFLFLGEFYFTTECNYGDQLLKIGFYSAMPHFTHAINKMPKVKARIVI